MIGARVRAGWCRRWCLVVVLATTGLAACNPADNRLPLAQAQPVTPGLPSVGPGATSGALNPTLVNLPEERWVRLEPKPSRRYIPRKFERSEALEDDPNPQGRDYSGLVYGDGRLFYFGGGHGGYMGNDVEVYDIGRNIWTQSYQPDVAPETGSDSQWIHRLAPGGRAWVEHTYQVGCYDPTTRTVLWLLQFGGTMRFDPATNGWTPVAGPHARGTLSDSLVTQHWGVRACLGYDPDLRTMLVMETSELPGVYAWRGRSWSRHGSVPPVTEYRTPYATYMPDRHKYFVWNGLRWWIYDAVKNRWTSLTPPAGAHMDSFDYDTANRVIVGTNYREGVFRMWRVEPEKNEWTELPVASPHPVQRIGGSAAAPLLRYDPIHNVFLFIVYRGGAGGTSTPTELWAWRHKKASGG